MSSLRLTTQLQQRMVLTPQLRQRIEMLQMTSMELSELIEQELVANPILEEVQPGEEVKEISDNILDQNADGNYESFENGHDPGSANGTGPADDFAPNSEPAQEYSENGLDTMASPDADSFDEPANVEPSDSFEE